MMGVQQMADSETGENTTGGLADLDIDSMDIDIYEFWAECRRDSPVVLVDEDNMGRATWMVTRYDDVDAVLRDPDRFSARINNETMGPVMGTLSLGMDGDEHRRYRSLVAQAFRPSALERWDSELVAPTIQKLLDAIAPLGRADLVLDVTSRYPVQVIAGVLGIPIDDFEKFQRWALDISQGPPDHSRSMPASREMRAYLEPIVAKRRENAEDDLVSDIVNAEIDGEKLSDEHVYGFLRLLLPAGAETTFRVVGSTLYALLTHPGMVQRCLDDPAMIDRAIEETLRWETSVTMVNREALEAVEIGGTTVPEGASVIVCTGSANHDETRYEDPENFDPDAERKAHIAFGTGRHQCLGMHLARLELRVGITQ